MDVLLGVAGLCLVTDAERATWTFDGIGNSGGPVPW